MAEPFMSEEQLIELGERYNATKELAYKKLGNKLPTELTNNIMALVQVINIVHLQESSQRLEESSLRLEKFSQSIEESSKRLERSSEKLNRLTLALIGLTVLLLILTLWSIGLSLVHVI